MTLRRKRGNFDSGSRRLRGFPRPRAARRMEVGRSVPRHTRRQSPVRPPIIRHVHRRDECESMNSEAGPTDQDFQGPLWVGLITTPCVGRLMVLPLRRAARRQNAAAQFRTCRRAERATTIIAQDADKSDPCPPSRQAPLNGRRTPSDEVSNETCHAYGFPHPPRPVDLATTARARSANYACPQPRSM